jgi:hypothetical protein
MAKNPHYPCQLVALLISLVLHLNRNSEFFVFIALPTFEVDIDGMVCPSPVRSLFGVRHLE